ncbi:MAG TPA: hypothetical protein VFN19_02020 [Candidatus Nanopelagicales bacterium]|nr:hypothetical protein [Candidatus Nanopelagicales bacterium]
MASPPTGRDNGLPPASSYVALVDVDPPLADQVLGLLREAGVPAVAAPLAGETGPYQDTRPPRRPTDRIHVDRLRVALARATVAGALPALRADFHADVARRSDADGMRAAEVDRVFSQIVSGFEQPVAGVGPWSALEDRDEDPDPPSRSGSGLSSRLVRRSVPEPAPEPVPDPTYWPEDHFVPPPPPPLPRLDRVGRFAWAGVVGGPALLILTVLVDLPLDRYVGLAAVGAFVGGFVALVARMPDRSQDQDGWDDGAVV